MLLAIDAGNSQMMLGLGDANSWSARWRIGTDPHGTADEYRALLDDLFRLEGAPVEAVDAVVVACVVPALTPVLVTTARRLFGTEVLVVGPDLPIGMEIRYEPPEALGSDRIADALAARERVGAPVVVVDCGTATTFNVVDRDGAFVGGAIAPGVGLAAEALAESGARLVRIDLTPPKGMSVVGTNTAASMRSGVIHGYAGLVEGLLARIDGELGLDGDDRAPALATGGMANVIAPLVGRIASVEPDLTLDGLRIVALRTGLV